MVKKVKGFEDFNIEGEKEKLKKIKRSFTHQIRINNNTQQTLETNLMKKLVR